MIGKVFFLSLLKNEKVFETIAKKGIKFSYSSKMLVKGRDFYGF